MIGHSAHFALPVFHHQLVSGGRTAFWAVNIQPAAHFINNSLAVTKVFHSNSLEYNRIRIAGRMFRRPRATEPDRHAAAVARILNPLPVWPWAGSAMNYLGVPVVLGASMLVVRDEDYTVACQKLKDAGFTQTFPDRAPAPEVLAAHPDPQKVIDEINAGFKRLDRSCTVFDYPAHHPHLGTQVFLLPNSFTHLPLQNIALSSHTTKDLLAEKQYNTYGNLHYPLEAALVESIVKAAIDDEDELGYSTWGEELGCWLSLITGYLEVNSDILDRCADSKAVEWYSIHFGRVRESKYGPMDRRISKRLGSQREMPVDMRGNLI
ncbi:predicted protein [Uncinocarpus reesii 1704]|uniref:Uncharacterized protein n=1 Tax=Uncinocarpus reesii (strain UAMH 1704) TaxID=336963 RepID=C4JXY9_UNCRE|nr:uncharacterized protein UREG_07040 [Uncinocarpus reesii 1704]EEP82175.1 predicted protein [Uncinocarpus reesii 1704]